MNPDDIDDSALGSAVYLCGAGGSLADPAGHGPRGLPLQPLRLLRPAGAVLPGRLPDRRLRRALAAAPAGREGREGRQGASPRPAPRKHATTTKHTAASPRAEAGSRPAPKPAPKPDRPSPAPSPTPTSPARRRRTRSWCRSTGPGAPAVRRTASAAPALDLGPQNAWGDEADADFDGDGSDGDQRPGVRRAGRQARQPPGRAQGRRPRRLRHRRPRLPQRRRVLRPGMAASAPPGSLTDSTRSAGAERGTMSACPSTSRTPPSRPSAWSGSSRLVDKQSRDLVNAASELFDLVSRRGTAPQPRIHKELLRNTVELTTGICRTTDEAMDELAELIDLVRPLRRRARCRPLLRRHPPVRRVVPPAADARPPLRGADRPDPVVGPADADLGRARPRRRTPRARDADRLEPAQVVPPPAGALRLLPHLGRHRHRLRQQPGDDVPAAADRRAAVPVRDLGRLRGLRRRTCSSPA